MIKAWHEDAWDDYEYWQEHDRKTTRQINRLLKDIERNGPDQGIIYSPVWISLQRQMKQSLFRWHPLFSTDAGLFLRGGFPEFDCLADAFPGMEAAEAADVADLARKGKRYACIAGVGLIECSEDPMRLLRGIRELLAPGGVLLLGAENRLSLNRFCGDVGRFEQENAVEADGLRPDLKQTDADGGSAHQESREKCAEASGDGESARRVTTGREYTCAELKELLRGAGFRRNTFLSVFPVLERPQVLLADGFVPNENLDIRIFPQYRNPETVFLRQERLYDPLVRNGLLFGMANGYLITSSAEESDAETDRLCQVTVSSDRGRELALATMLTRNGRVVKRALFPEGQGRITGLSEHTAYLKAHGVPMIDGVSEGDSWCMPFVEGQTALMHYRELMCTDREKLKQELADLWEIILHSSEVLPDEELTEAERPFAPILERGYVDLVALNGLIHDGKPVFFDQETFMERFPAKAIFMRTLDDLYNGDERMEVICPREELIRHFDLEEHLPEWRAFAMDYIRPLRRDDELMEYNRLHRADPTLIRENERRMHISPLDLERERQKQEADRNRFLEVLKGAHGKKIYLFGAGRYAKRFLAAYRDYLQISGIFDNDPAKWGTTLEGIKVMAPEMLEVSNASGSTEASKSASFDRTNCRVYICMKDFSAVQEQLARLGVEAVVYR